MEINKRTEVQENGYVYYVAPAKYSEMIASKWSSRNRVCVLFMTRLRTSFYMAEILVTNCPT